MANAAGGSAAVQSKFRRCVHTSPEDAIAAKRMLECRMGFRLDPAKGYFAGEPAKQGTTTTTSHTIIAYPCYDEA